MVQKNNEKTKKKHHARLLAQVPASSVSKSPDGNNRQERKDAVSGQEDGKHQSDNRLEQDRSTRKKHE